jgi:hypothetical protein
MTERNFYYHYIPKVNRSAPLEGPIDGPRTKDMKIIGIIDSSYSMHDVWPLLVEQWNALVNEVGHEHFITLCFDNELHHNPETPLLTPSINSHGGKSTNIKIAFEHIEKEIFPKYDANTEFKIIFVSDGQDNQNGGTAKLEAALDTLQGGLGREITFLCLGVLSGFPTFISMKLRAKYHTGDEAIPSIFLIEYASDKAFFNKFQSIREHMKTAEPMPIDPPQLFFPWQGLMEIAKEGQWIFSKDKQITLLPENQAPIVLSYQKFNVEAVSDIFRSWVQKLQLDCLNKKITNEETIEYAQSTKLLVDAILLEVKQFEEIDLLTNVQDPNLNFYKRCLNQQVSHSKVKIEGYLNDLNQLVKGNTPQKMSEFEAAKMIGLGTIVGKYQQKALALKNMGREAFAKVKDEFLTVVEKLRGKIDAFAADEAKSMRSEKSGLCFMDFLKDPTLSDGLGLLNSPYDLLETLPLVGIGFNLKRFDGSKDNSFLTKIQKMPTLSKTAVVDTVFLNQNPEFIQKHGDMEINSVLPLLDPTVDLEFAEIYQTKLFQLLMTFNVTLNVDRIDDSAYLALLGSAVAHFVDSAKEITENVAVILKKISGTLEMLYTGKGVFYELVEAIEGDFAGFLGGAKETPEISNIILAVLYLHFNKNMEKDELWEIYEKVWIEYFARRFKSQPNACEKMITFNFESNLVSTFLEKVSGKKILEEYWTSREIIRDVDSKFSNKSFEINPSAGSNATINENGLREESDQKINYGTLTKLQVFLFKGDESLSTQIDAEGNCTEAQTIAVICCALKHMDDPVGRSTAALSYDVDFNNKTLANNLYGTANKENKDAKKKFVQRVKTQILSKCKLQYFSEFQKNHWEVKPLKWDQIQTYCTANNIDATQIKYTKDSMLVTNACQSPDCPHFLKPNPKRLRDHLGGWQEKMPRGFHLFVNNHMGSTEEEIYGLFVTERGIKEIEKYGLTREKAVEYVRTVKAGYNEAQG